MSKVSKADAKAPYVDPARPGKRRLKRERPKTAAHLRAKLVAARAELEEWRQLLARREANPPRNQHGEPFMVNWLARTTREVMELRERKVEKLERQLAELEGSADGTES